MLEDPEEGGAGPIFEAPSPLASPRPAPNPPCSTLFIANLHPQTHEADLSQLFKMCALSAVRYLCSHRSAPGFKQLKLHYGNESAPVCFVEFQDVKCSTQALNLMQGTPCYVGTVGPDCARRSLWHHAAAH